MKFSAVATLITIAVLFEAQAPARQETRPGDAAGTQTLRTVTPLLENWKFILDDSLTEQAALASSAESWQTVNLPHTWNAEDAASLKATDYKRGIGWYRREFDAPAGARHWLEIGAASLVADVWLNGEKLGRHKGGFTQFRFDLTDHLRPNGRNVLIVRTDNRDPKREDDDTAIAPLGGDFNVSGGLYRHVALISTRDPVHITLGDMGGPGVYARSTAVARGGNAEVEVRSKVKSDAKESGQYVMRASLLDAGGKPAATADRPVTIAAGALEETSQTLTVPDVHVWQGIEDPYQYQLVVEVRRGDEAIDRVSHPFGIRDMRFDANDGFFLNGRHVRLRGVAQHQGFLGKAWGVTNEEIDESIALIKEIGANAIRFGHYPFSRHAAEKASEEGFVVWGETALGLGTTVERCTQHPPTQAYVENAKQQLQELIRQEYNHAAIALWSVGNETTARQMNCDVPYDNVRPLLRELHELAKQEDPSRPTAYAEMGHPVDREGVYATEHITDVFATNRYFGWYTTPFTDFSPLLDGLHELAYKQPLGVSEYGAGAATTHHTDNPLGGPPDVRSAAMGETAWQPEEYAAWVHEENYRVIAGKTYLWGSFVWNMFDFGSAHRNEGDTLGVNTKGLVTFDRRTRKDPFFFYKANWSLEPVTYITSRRYTDRAYAVTNVKVYSNADSVSLSINGKTFAAKKKHECPMATCVFKAVPLDRGENVVEAEGRHGDQVLKDTVRWLFNAEAVNIAAGWLATGYVSADGQRFGSDNFFLGGDGLKIEVEQEAAPESFTAKGATEVAGTRDPTLYRHYRSGQFAYDVPLPDGRYTVTLGFVEPNANGKAGGRVFDVTANGETALSKMDVLKETGGRPLTAVTKSFPVSVSGGRLMLEFVPVRGDAMVSNIMIRRAGSGTLPSSGAGETAGGAR